MAEALGVASSVIAVVDLSAKLDSAIKDSSLILEKLAQALEPSTGRKTMSRFGIRALKWPFESKDNVDHNIALDRLPIAEGDIFIWIDHPGSKIIFWLNGMAGTGKSTISRTIARSWSKQGDLGASFFFRRGETDRGNLSKVVSTLACQLARNVPGVASVIKKALDADPAIGPLLEVGKAPIIPSSVVIVIDALDECERDADIRLLINVLSPRLRVFLTSRPELPICLGFSEVHGTY
ncbi:hypothetical protein B0J15DRAFT_534068 [Fusarium solani]|uniref:NACHT domain-containing protein n=1 Tax=Fusarium solani TaxID=169388 RepID=A0A9P9KPW0_FUSSL|nr:uncharacterized protein B0J15DRAFT_534068 [Fusarium solani]KAH7265754.1 hypothetical protein B0J15DRAFT_534068 [Fusarium solani]